MGLYLDSLATLYGEMGNDEQAKLVHQRALRIFEQALGPEHPLVAFSLHGLARLCREQGADEEAESLYQRALQIRERQRGPHHPETGLTLADLARLRQQQDKLDEALTLAERALQILSPSLGDTHPKTVATRLLVAQLGETRGTSQDGASCPREAEEHPNDSSTAHRQEEAVLTPQEPSESFPSDHDPLQAFLTACCELHSHAWSRSAEIWQAYQHWTEEHHERYPLARGAFLAQLKRHGCRADRTTTARIWRGIGLLKNGL